MLKILVITDRYPPDIVGGAEISLASILYNLSSHKNVDISLITFSEIDHPKTEKNKNIFIYRFPIISTEWPKKIFKITHKKIKQKPLKGLAILFDRLLYFIFYTKKVYLIKHIYNKARLVQAGYKDQYSVDEDLLTQYPYLKDIDNLVYSINPDLIHADNLYSIIVANRFKNKFPIVSQVRDSRFLCVKPSGECNIDQIPCTNCEFNCLKKDTEIDRRLTWLFDQNKKFRHSTLLESNKIIVTSEYLKNQLKIISDDKQNPLVIPNPIGDMMQWIENTPNINKKPELNILYVGRLNYNKGAHFIPKIVSEIHKNFANFKIIIAGRGELFDNLNNYQSSHQLGHHIELMGHVGRPDLAKLYRKSKFVICPGVWPEPFGRVPLEASVFFKPTIAFATGGFCETVINNETGILVHPGDLDSFCKAIVCLLKNPAEQIRLGNAAHELNNKKYKLEDLSLKLYQTWLSIKNQ